MVDSSDLMERYRAQVVQLKTEYERAVANTERAGDEVLDMPEPDKSVAYSNALVAEHSVLRAYERAVVDFAEMLLHGGPRTDEGT